MPLPKPTADENQDEFMNRCMADPVMNDEYSDPAQRFAICTTQWEGRKVLRRRKMERKYFNNVEIKLDDADAGTWECYASTWKKEPDPYGDVVDKGAFSKTIKENIARIKNLWNHSIMEPIGKPIHIEEDSKGLFARNKLSLGVQRAQEIRELMYDGVINETSIGFDTIQDKIEGTGRDAVRHLKEVRLWDISPVSFAANEQALVLGVKSMKDYAELSEFIQAELTEVKAGRVLSAANVSKLEDALKALQALLAAATPEEEPGKTTPSDVELKEAAEWDAIIGRLQAENDGFDSRAAIARIDDILAQIK